MRITGLDYYLPILKLRVKKVSEDRQNRNEVNICLEGKKGIF